MYRIGIVDDAEMDISDIQVAIWESCDDPSRVQFKNYELSHRKKEDILREMMDDVTGEIIQALIVDFKLDTAMEVIKGWEIVDFVHNETPEFPMIILTHAPEEGRESPYTDADKVYAKKTFLKVASEESRVMVENIFLNIERYVKNRKDIESELEIELRKLDQDSTDETVLRRVMELETRLRGYKRMNQTIIDRNMDLGELKEVLNELRKCEELMQRK